MKITEINTGVMEALAGLFGHDDRSEGLHASQIWTDLAAGIDKSKRSPITQDKLQDFGALGFLWEKVLEKTLASMVMESDHEGRYMRPGEQCIDGIYLTPDYVDLDFLANGTWQIGCEEWKVRWCSYRKADDLEKNFWLILVQLKAYCRAINTNFARLRMLFVVGNWKDDITPKLREFELTFSDQELADNWSMLVNHARRRGWLK